MTLANRFSKINIYMFIGKAVKIDSNVSAGLFFSHFGWAAEAGGRFLRNSIPHLEIGKKKKQTIIIYFLSTRC